MLLFACCFGLFPCRVPQMARLHQCINECSRNSECVSFFDRGGLFAPLIAIDDRQDFVAANGGIAAHIVVINLNDQRAVLHAAAQELRYVVGAIVQAIIRADDL